jgi:hypothetical protein
LRRLATSSSMGYMPARTETVTTPKKLSAPANEASPWRRSHSVTRKTSATGLSESTTRHERMRAQWKEQNTASGALSMLVGVEVGSMPETDRPVDKPAVSCYHGAETFHAEDVPEPVNSGGTRPSRVERGLADRVNQGVLKTGPGGDTRD